MRPLARSWLRACPSLVGSVMVDRFSPTNTNGPREGKTRLATNGGSLKIRTAHEKGSHETACTTRGRHSGVLTMRGLVLALLLAVLAASSQGADKNKPDAGPKAKAQQQQAAPPLDTSSLEKTIREVIEEESKKHEPNEQTHLKQERQLVEETRQLAVSTESLSDLAPGKRIPC